VFRNVLSRRVCEVVGVASFALSLMWLVALMTYAASDPVLFFSSPAHGAPANLSGRVGAFLGEMSFQVLGYGAYLIPPTLVVIGWHYFWVRALKAPITKVLGALLLFGSVSALLSLAFERLDIGGKRFPAGGLVGKMIADLFVSELNRTGSLIVLLTIVFLAAIMATQLSLGAVASALAVRIAQLFSDRLAALRTWREERRREQQRKDVIRKHLEKGTQPEVVAKAVRAQKQVQEKAAKADAAAAAASAAPPAEGRSRRSKTPAAEEVAETARRGSRDAAAAATAANAGMDEELAAAPMPKARPQPQVRIKTPSLPLPDPEPLMKAPAERRKGEFILPPPSLLDAATSRTSAASSRSRARWSRSTRGRWSRPTNSNRKRASSTPRSPASPTTCRWR
jgi:DNA segregation ATPase FtsK/SpoIIIE-like protein